MTIILCLIYVCMQPSCDVVGMLPTEEAELRRALYASLMPKNPKTKKTSKSPNLTGVEFLLGGDSSASGRLKSPEMIYDLDSKSPSVTVLESLNESQPASPLSCHSTTPLNLFLSSSSWSTTDSSPSCDSSLSSWSPGVQDRERGNLPNKKKNTDGCKVTRKKGSKEGKRDTVVATKSKIEPPPNKRRKKINQKKMVCDSGVSTSTGDGGAVGTDGGAVGTDGGAVGTDGGGVGTDGGAGCDAATGGADPSTCTSIKVQAQRKFPANQNPPTRYSREPL